jgi:hypothetical protein
MNRLRKLYALRFAFHLELRSAIKAINQDPAILGVPAVLS